MRFKEHYELNEKLGMGKEYQVPKDREERLYDFYALTMVYPTEYSFNDSQEDEKYYFNDALEKITTTLLKDFETVLRFSISSELGHLGTDTAYFDPETDSPYVQEYGSVLKELLDANEDMDETDLEYSERYAILKKMFPDINDFKDFAIASFDEENVEWENEFGGDAWLKIAKGLRQVLTAKEKKLGDKIVTIDHVYDLQHNNATVFNKVKQYYKYGGHEWLAHALDKKRDVTEPHELIKHVSGPLKRPLTAAYKIVLKKSFDAVPKQSSVEEIKKFLDNDTNGKVIENKDGTYSIENSDVLITLDGVENGQLKHAFKEIEEGFSFDCSKLGLTSLIGAPQLSEHFDCSDNNLTSLDGAPKQVHSFDASNNKLTSLEGGPKTCSTDYDVARNKLTNFVGAPTIKGKGRSYDSLYINANNNPINSMKGLTKAVDTVAFTYRNISPDSKEIKYAEDKLGIEIN